MGGTFHCVVDGYGFYCILQDGMYKPVVVSDRVGDVRVRHDCSSTFSIPLCCIDAYGRFNPKLNGKTQNLRAVLYWKTQSLRAVLYWKTRNPRAVLYWKTQNLNELLNLMVEYV